KFYEPDIDRLRWILIQQRENFLPLKVIRERLGNGEGEIDPTLFDDFDRPADDSTSGAETPGSEDESPVESVTSETAAVDSEPPTTGEEASAPDAEEPQPIWMADLAASKGAKTLRQAAALPLDAGPTEVSLTRAELLSAAGISADQLRQLEQFGLLSGRSYGEDVYYDGDALLIATRSAAFFGHGIEVRHLRMFKVAAEREAGFLEQVAMPMLKQRNPDARRQAVELVEELSQLGGDLRSALLRANLRRHLDRS
ncbi:MAG: hypothetical protein KDB02_07410, partial [Acidimicrobiales bacterium]|nr:hypothetical protein [Acidimicrobiales bacterium]